MPKVARWLINLNETKMIHQTYCDYNSRSMELLFASQMASNNIIFEGLCGGLGGWEGIDKYIYKDSSNAKIDAVNHFPVP